jgi:tetratricopeptide (TPR) repeat protein
VERRPRLSYTEGGSDSSGTDDKSGRIQKPIAEAVDALVAEAAARRVRRDYTGAVAALIDALRIDPNNASVALLIAGVYEQRGMFDEALIWYQSAQKLSPENTTAANGIRELTSRVRFSPARAQSGPAGSNLKVWIAAAAAILVLVVLAVLIRGAKQTTREVSRKALTTAPPPKAVVIPGVPRANSGLSTPTRPARSTYGGSPVVASRAPAQVRTAPEETIKSKLLDTQGYWSPQARIDDVTADPRYAGVTVTFSLPPSTQINRAMVLQNSFYIAAAAFLAHNEVQVVTIRCAIPGEQNGFQLAFVGDITRQTALSFDGGVTTAQINASFTSAWWNPRISQ